MRKLEFPDPLDDGLIIPQVKHHTKYKHYFLSRYVHAFTTAMRKKKWAGLYYLDLFASAGIQRIKDTDDLIWGSPLIAAQVEPAFDKLIFCEIDEENRNALIARLKRIRPTFNDRVELGDANKLIRELTREIKPRSLTLAFLDPHGMHLHYETVKILSQKRCDLIIYFPDRVDFLRNWKLNYFDDPESNPDKALGPGVDWRSAVQGVPHVRIPEILRRLYVSQLQKLGYEHFAYQRICTLDGMPIYQLIFGSKHSLGVDIWEGVSKIQPDGQSMFDFGGAD